MSVNKKVIGIIAILLLLVIIPLTVLVSQKQQDIRQRASESEEATVFFANVGSSNPTILSQISLSSNDQQVLALYVDTGNISIQSFDITINLRNALQYVTIREVNEGTDAQRFETETVKRIDQSSGIIRFGKVTQNTTQPIRGKLYLGWIAFSVKPDASNASGVIDITRAELTSYGRDPLTVDKSKTLAYTIGSSSNPTNTPTPSPTLTPTATVTQTPTQTPVPTATLTPTATGTVAPGATRFNFDLILTGIGPNGGNANPRNQQRDISVGIYSATEILVKTVRGTINFIQESGTFRGSADVSNITPGNYTLKVTVMDGQNKSMYLTKKMLGVQTITSTGGQIDILPTALTVGDLSHSGQSDNQVDILDFNIFRDCYGDKISNSMSCPNPEIADLDDNGVGGDNTDYQLLINSLSSQHGD